MVAAESPRVRACEESRAQSPVPDDRAQEAGFPAPTRGARREVEQAKAGDPPNGPNEGHIFKKGKVPEAVARFVGVARGEEGLVARGGAESASAPVHAPFEQAIAPSPRARSARLRLEGEAETAGLRARAHRSPDGRRAAVGKPRVGMHEDENLSGCRPGPRSELGAPIPAGRQDAAMGGRDLPRTIPAAPVDHDDFRFGAESGSCAPERLIEPRFLIERRHDDGKLLRHPRSGSSRISRRTPFSERGCRNAMRAPPAPARIRGGMASAPAASAPARAASRSSTRTQTW